MQPYPCEVCEVLYDKSEEMHGFRVVKRLGTPIHKVKRLASITLFNSKKSVEKNHPPTSSTNQKLTFKNKFISLLYNCLFY